MSQPIANTPEAWTERAAAERPHDAALWSEQGQQERFAAVLAALDPQPGETLLDYGCGTGALADQLPPETVYVGYDWAQGMIVRAAQDHPGRAFTGNTPISHFDLVAAVGPFNLPDNWSKQHTWHILRSLWDTTQCRALAASLYAGDSDICLIYTEAELEREGRAFGAAVDVLRHRPNDLLFVVSR